MSQGFGYESRAGLLVGQVMICEEGWIDGVGLLGAHGYKSPAISPCVYSSSRNVLYLS